MNLQNLRELTNSTKEPAFVTDITGRILSWNSPMASLVGVGGDTVRQKRCYQLLAGTDSFGSAVCGPNCPVMRKAICYRPLESFLMSIRNAAGHPVHVKVSTIVLPAATDVRRFVLHLLQPCETEASSANGNGVNGTFPPKRNGNGNGGRGALSRRELQILRLLAKGRRTHEIAKTLTISTVTVRNHVQHILEKLHAHSRLEAVRSGRQLGILDDESFAASGATAPPADADRDAHSTLSLRELEVLQFLADGRSTAETARELAISAATVRNHVQHILRKLHVHSRLDAVRIATSKGLL